MKKLMIMAGFAAVIATPALARPAHPAHPQVQTHAASAWVPVQSPNDVYVGGVYVGTDPDPNIRLSLAHEYPSPLD